MSVESTSGGFGTYDEAGLAAILSHGILPAEVLNRDIDRGDNPVLARPLGSGLYFTEVGRNAEVHLHPHKIFMLNALAVAAKLGPIPPAHLVSLSHGRLPTTAASPLAQLSRRIKTVSGRDVIVNSGFGRRPEYSIAGIVFEDYPYPLAQAAETPSDLHEQVIHALGVIAARKAAAERARINKSRPAEASSVPDAPTRRSIITFVTAVPKKRPKPSPSNADGERRGTSIKRKSGAVVDGYVSEPLTDSGSGGRTGQSPGGLPKQKPPRLSPFVVDSIESAATAQTFLEAVGVSASSPDQSTYDWRHKARCATTGGDPELFFPVGTAGPALLQIAEAKTVCRECPSCKECLTWALKSGQDTGVWGGMSEDERRALKRRNTRTQARTV